MMGALMGAQVWTPSNLAVGYYPFTYAAGARVHSDSWGSAMTVYDSLAASVDLYTWQHPDFLPIFAAGRAKVPGGSGAWWFRCLGGSVRGSTITSCPSWQNVG